MSNRLQEKVVIVTGAAQGIGFGCARLLAAEGAAVVLGDIQKERGEQSAAIIRKEGGEALFCPADVREEQQCAALIEKAVQSYGKLNGLVNNAGWFPRATLEETTTELWEQILQVNLRSAFYCCKHAVPRMREAKGGSIVNIGSICGIQSLPNLVAYGAAKEELLRKEGEKLRFGRQQKPLDAAYAVVYLLSDESSQVTGTIFHIDAGESTLRGMYP